MQVKLRTLGGLAVICFLSFFGWNSAQAATPQLQVTAEGGSQVRITVSQAPSFAQVDVYQRVISSNLWSSFMNIGRTDGSGYFTTSGYYGAADNQIEQEFYTIIGGQRSPSVTLGTNNGCGSYSCQGGITFSPSTVQVNVGQSQAVTIYSNTYNYSYYISSNSNPGVASANVSGSTLYINGLSNGNTTLTICANSAGCGSVLVTVSGSTSGNITFSQSNPTVQMGQSQLISIFSNNFNSNYYISSNSNPGVVTAVVSGSTLQVLGQSQGSSTITVCGSNAGCGTLNVTVNGLGGGGGNITFSQQNVTLNDNQSVSISIFGGTGTYYISQNTNPAVAAASITGSTLYLTRPFSGQYGNNTVITVCSSNSLCGSVYVNAPSSPGNNTITFSQSSVALNQGQQNTVQIYSNAYNPSYYISNNEYPNIVGANISGSTLTLFGSTYGSSRITVCGSGSVGCGTLTVNVSGGNVGGLTLSQTSLTLNSGQTAAVTVYGVNTNAIYISQNSNPSVATAVVSGYTVTLYASQVGNTTFTICSYSQSGCANLQVSVGGGAGQGGQLNLQTTRFSVNPNQYANVQLQATNGQPPYTYTLNSGQLPSGLNVSNAGLISGVTYSSGMYTAYVRVSDNYGRSSTIPITITVGNVQGATAYRTGTLISDNGTIYMIYRNTKTAFASWSAFWGLGFRQPMVQYGSITNIPDSGYVVYLASSAHPWGSWVRNGRTVYFVHEQGLIPVPSGDVFTNNGGNWNLIVPANSWDLRKPILSSMEWNDYRLQ
jgi:hypothetical protein